MVTTRTGIFMAIRLLLLSISVLVGVAASADASLLTMSFSGSVNLSGSGGAANNPFSGFFTWDTTKLPEDTDPNSALYLFESYQLIFNGVDRTIGPGGAGVFVVNDGNPVGTGNVDGLLFLAGLEKNVTIGGVTGDTLLVMAFTGPTTTWNTVSLPTDAGFLSQLTTRLAAVSLEVPFGGDDNDVSLGEGTVTAAAVPEPATVLLGALGLAGMMARARRSRQRRGR
jgi:hypothetical protein